MQQKNLDIYGHDALPWSRAKEQLEAGTTPSFWLATIGSDGRPHMASVGALWYEDKIYFVSGPQTRKSRNLAANPACVFSVTLPNLDLVLEGDAVRVTDAATLARLARRYNDGEGWPVQVSGDAFTAPYSAPSAGPPPWYLYVMEPKTAFGVATAEPHGATRWEF
jgi:hypothetical protein